MTLCFTAIWYPTCRSFHQCPSFQGGEPLTRAQKREALRKKRNVTKSRPQSIEESISKPQSPLKNPVQRLKSQKKHQMKLSDPSQKPKVSQKKQNARTNSLSSLSENEAPKLGRLAKNSIFAGQEISKLISEEEQTTEWVPRDTSSPENLANMQRILDPRPFARQRWLRKMVIRQVRRRGRLTKEMKLARTERSHLAKSHFFKTSVKKLMPLARQIAGKSIDDAVLQMRFSKKQVARDVRQHLIQARNEAIVMRGMGMGSASAMQFAHGDGPLRTDAGNTPANNPTERKLARKTAGETDIYIAQAWVNRGPYEVEPSFRGRGRVDVIRHRHTGLSVLLKEEKTRTREALEKEAKHLRKRMGKNMWTQLPDRKVTRQSQYLLW